jgi:hypothetical protein
MRKLGATRASAGLSCFLAGAVVMIAIVSQRTAYQPVNAFGVGDSWGDVARAVSRFAPALIAPSILVPRQAAAEGMLRTDPNGAGSRMLSFVGWFGVARFIWETRRQAGLYTFYPPSLMLQSIGRSVIATLTAATPLVLLSRRIVALSRGSVRARSAIAGLLASIITAATDALSWFANPPYDVATTVCGRLLIPPLLVLVVFGRAWPADAKSSETLFSQDGGRYEP